MGFQLVLSLVFKVHTAELNPLHPFMLPIHLYFCHPIAERSAFHFFYKKSVWFDRLSHYLLFKKINLVLFEAAF